MKKFTLGILFFSAAIAAYATPKTVTGDKFYVYDDAASRNNHFCPSGWMGDTHDMHFNQRYDKKPVTGKKYSIEIKYTAERKDGAGWAGIYFQDPCDNWGDKKGGFDLSGFKVLKFKARGETGKEWLEKFMVGGITGQGVSSDSMSSDTGQIQLTKDWKEYSISLEGEDLTEVIGGFGLVFSADSAPNGETVYLSDIRFEK